ncbi:hypothetical protein [Desulfurella sp.]|uniref:hypothetical protein n=1 Tax=Desulfurella sp. TaxID=1962857 RepID=UPI0025BCD8E9|nr:hypothetical protein [Desulfurella sp.]
MKIRIAENAGFCYGVKRAIKIADEALKKNKIIYSLGPIIHNPQVVSRYEKKGLKVVETIDEAKNAVLIRSHGIPPQVYEQISEKNLECIDATCPFVKEAQDYAKQLYEEDYFVVIVGDQNHPEVKAHIAYANYKAQVINSIQEAKNIEAQKIKQEQEISDMEAYYKEKKKQQDEAKKIQQLARWKQELAQDQGDDLTSGSNSNSTREITPNNVDDLRDDTDPVDINIDIDSDQPIKDKKTKTNKNNEEQQETTTSVGNLTNIASQKQLLKYLLNAQKAQR